VNLHVDLKARLRRIVSQALDGASYEASETEPGGMLVMHALRPDGSAVHVRFRGVRDSATTAWPQRGAPLRVKSVGSTESFFVFLLPRILRGPAPFAARIRLDAGGATIDLVCQDAEWWEGSAAEI
jgi:hypothetical protein